jgi:maleylpyruvate isomerase
MDDGTRLFLGALADLGDDDLDRPLALPGWTGRHVVAHVHYNARALGRLVQWATTGTENRMYASPEQRASEIEAGEGPELAAWLTGRVPAAPKLAAWL